jgi:hypothetical protein
VVALGTYTALEGLGLFVMASAFLGLLASSTLDSVKMLTPALPPDRCRR